jgi:peptidyl-prolyl cis-trans isomerase A (cyclophilin A)
MKTNGSIMVTALVVMTVAFSSAVWAGGKSTGTKNPQVVIETSLGAIEVELFSGKAPLSVKNFLQYTKDKFYDNTVFHRVIPGFMVQGGGMDASLKKKPTRDPIKNEAKNGLKNERGTLAMARTSEVNSATSQFFINLKDNKFLDHGSRGYGYAVFAKVVRGMNVVDKIAQVKTGAKGAFRSDCPQETLYIKSIRLKK